ncbi:MAG: hypothetical protein LW630_11145 [Saprospiraceae bacterium]|nr:hypothetical protein [Saprospiraceae bacterium]
MNLSLSPLLNLSPTFYLYIHDHRHARMRTIDLKTTSTSTVNKHIATICGETISHGPIARWLGKGLAGFSFFDPADETKEAPYKVNIALYQQGIGLYFRNRFANRLVLIPQNEINKIHILQEQEIIRPLRFSLYSTLLRLGASHESAAPYLMPREIVTQNPAQCTIHTPESFILLHLDKAKPSNAILALQKAELSLPLHIEISKPQIIRV